jgi:hypothetical protein
VESILKFSRRDRIARCRDHESARFRMAHLMEWEN